MKIFNSELKIAIMQLRIKKKKSSSDWGIGSHGDVIILAPPKSYLKEYFGQVGSTLESNSKVQDTS